MVFFLARYPATGHKCKSTWDCSGPSGDKWDGSGQSGDEWDGSGRCGGSVINAIPLLLVYSIEANLCILAVISFNVI